MVGNKCTAQNLPSKRLQTELYYTNCPVKAKLYKDAIPTALPYDNPKHQLAASLECEKQNSVFRSVFREGGIVKENLMRWKKSCSIFQPIWYIFGYL